MPGAKKVVEFSKCLPGFVSFRQVSEFSSKVNDSNGDKFIHIRDWFLKVLSHVVKFLASFSQSGSVKSILYLEFIFHTQIMLFSHGELVLY